LIALWTFVRRPASVDDGGVPLGPEGIELVYPVGRVPSLDRFEWRAELPPGGRFELILKASAAAAAPLHSERLRETRWTPDAEQRAQLPRDLWWEVRVLGADDEVLSADGREASAGG
jgi:hypothetical protein